MIYLQSTESARHAGHISSSSQHNDGGSDNARSNDCRIDILGRRDRWEPNHADGLCIASHFPNRGGSKHRKGRFTGNGELVFGPGAGDHGE